MPTFGDTGNSTLRPIVLSKLEGFVRVQFGLDLDISSPWAGYRKEVIYEIGGTHRDERA